MSKRKLSRHQARRIDNIQDKRRRRAQERAARQQERAARQEEQLQNDGLGAEQTGIVIAHYGSQLIVEAESGDQYSCVARRNLGGLVCGDRVVWQAARNNEGVISARLERDSVLARPGYDGRRNPLAANIDCMVIVCAVMPLLSTELIDRYLAAAELSGIQPIILVNKIDLLDELGMEQLAEQMQIYEDIGYPVIHASIQTAHGLDALREGLKDRTAVLVGQSGVGKSSLASALMPERDIRVGAISEASGLGKHTTTTSMFYRLPGGGAIIDSPGVRQFHLWQVDSDELARGFIEFREHVGMCRFANCRHESEPGCALKFAVDNGHISEERFFSYLRIRASLEDAAKRQQGY